MTKLLLKLFVKGYSDLDNPKAHGAVGTMAGVTGVVCNLLLFILKIAVGILSGAVSVVADALNNLTDTASSVVTLFGFRLAQRPADADHPYGHARYEYISGLAVAALILVIGVELGRSSVLKIFDPSPLSVSLVTVVTLFCAIIIKFWMCLFYAKLGKSISSSTLKAAAIDSRNDVIASAAVLLGCVLEWVFSLSLDGYIGLAVGIFIIWSGVGIARETISPLLGQRADAELVRNISSLILSNDKVLGFHDLLVHDYGPGKCFASVHVEISASEDPMACHEIIDAIECNVFESLNVNLVIHYDPVLDDDVEWQEMSGLLQKIIKELDDDLEIHGFRIVRGGRKTKLVFDLAVPYGMTLDETVIRESIHIRLQECGKEYITIIRFDNKD